MPSDLLLVSTLDHDPVVQLVGRMRPGATRVLTNLCHTQLTADIGASSGTCRLILNGDSIHIDDLNGIVVSGMPCRAGPGFSHEDSRYIEHETLAAWMAMLCNARCRVLNRPGFTVPQAALMPLHARTTARSVGIPTIDDLICCGRELLCSRARGMDIACVDVVDHSAFWLTADRQIEDDRLYSATSVFRSTQQILIAFVAGRYYGAAIPDETHPRATELERSLLNEAGSLAQHLSAAFQLDYAFYSFALIRERLHFSRVFPYWPGLNHTAIVSWTAAAILADLDSR